MSSSLNNLLSQAYGFIEADQLDEAVNLLKPILAENPNNPDAWWLYAHAVENVDDARAALQTVLNLNPNYPEAQRLLDMLEEATKGVGTGNPLNDISLQPIRTISDEEAGVTADDEPFGRGVSGRRDFDERVSALGKSAASEAFPWRNIALLGALFVGAMIVALIFGSELLNAPPAATATVVGADRTAIAIELAATGTAEQFGVAGTVEPAALTATAIIAADAGGGVAQNAGTPTTEGLLTAPTGAEAAALTATAAIAASAGNSGSQDAGTPTPEGLPADPTNAALPTVSTIDLSSLTIALSPLGDGTRVGVEQTARGESLVLTLCSQEPNVSLRDTLRQAVGLIAGQPVVTDPQVEGVGFRLIDCANDSRVLRVLTAAASDVVEYAGGVIDAGAFEARLLAE